MPNNDVDIRLVPTDAIYRAPLLDAFAVWTNVWTNDTRELLFSGTEATGRWGYQDHDLINGVYSLVSAPECFL